MLPGNGRLEVELVAGQSAVTSVRALNPLKILTPRSRGPSVWAYTSSFGGGFVAGDEITLDIRVAAGAKCFLSTQASTKVYRNPNSRPCRHTSRAHVAAGAVLVLAPDPVQCFADSIYEQRQQFYLAPEAGLVLVDWLSAGRVARGERWAFTRYHSRNEIFSDTVPVLIDSLLLDPHDGPLDAPERMGRFSCLAMVAIVGEPLKQFAEHLLQSVVAEPVTRRSPLVYAASPLKQGALLRVAGASVEQVGRELARHLGFVGELLKDDPWLRKW